jgi:hypothetical protein
MVRRPLGPFVLLAVLAILLVSAPAQAQTLTSRAPPPHRLIHRSLVALRANPVGLIYDGRLGYRLRLYDSESLALRDNYAGGGLAATVSPAFVRVGPYVEFAPASIITVWSSLHYGAYLGTFGLLQSFPSPRADFSDDELDRRAELEDDDPLKNYDATGLELTVGLDLQAKVGPIAVRSQTRSLYADLDLREGDRVYYDQVTDLLLPDEGWSLTTDFDTIYLALQGRLAVGARYTASIPLYAGDSYLPGEPEEHDNTTQRLGPLIAYSFFNRDGAAFNAPTILLIAQWWLDHRYRTGEETSQGVPLVALAFRFHGDLLAFD